MATLQEKMLGQARENSTNAVSIYSPAVNVTAIIKSVVVCNQTGTAATFRIFLDADGTTYDQSTALFYDTDIGANVTTTIDSFWAMTDVAGNLAYRSGTANALTITVFGAEIT